MEELTPQSPDPWTILMGLNLSRAEVECLQDQGFVAAEYRVYRGARLGPYFKLRWRRDGRQRVKYLGQDVEKAEAVSMALAQLQQKKVLERQLAAMISAARKSLKRAKKDMEPVLTTQGKYYHGFTSRKRRVDLASAPNVDR